MKREVLALRRGCKAFDGVTALDNVSVRLFQGEALGLLGLNGSGKTTLAQVLSGICPMDSGEIRVGGQPANVTLRNAFRKHGIFYIGQDSALVDSLSIQDNIFVIRKHKRFRLVLRGAQMREQTRQLLEEFGLSLDPAARAGQLTPRERMMVHILKAVSLRARVVIFDAQLGFESARDAQDFRYVLDYLRQMGTSIVYVTNRMDEPLKRCDRVAVMQGGRLVRTLFQDEYTQQKAALLLMGFQAEDALAPRPAPDGPAREAFSVRHLRLPGVPEALGFSVARGEVLGIAGLDASARASLERALFEGESIGARTWVDGREVRLLSVGQAIRSGVQLLPEQALRRALFQDQSVAENLCFMSGFRYGGRTGLVKRRIDRFLVSEGLSQIGLGGREDQRAAALVAAQKLQLLLKKIMVTKPRVLVAINPTAGADPIARRECCRALDHLARGGVAIVLVSPDAGELATLSDRVLVVCPGGAREVAKRDGGASFAQRILSESRLEPGEI